MAGHFLLESVKEQRPRMTALGFCRRDVEDLAVVMAARNAQYAPQQGQCHSQPASDQHCDSHSQAHNVPRCDDSVAMDSLVQRMFPSVDQRSIAQKCFDLCTGVTALNEAIPQA
jgi:hypothetical protein